MQERDSTSELKFEAGALLIGKSSRRRSSAARKYTTPASDCDSSHKKLPLGDTHFLLTNSTIEEILLYSSSIQAFLNSGVGFINRPLTFAPKPAALQAPPRTCQEGAVLAIRL